MLHHCHFYRTIINTLNIDFQFTLARTKNQLYKANQIKYHTLSMVSIGKQKKESAHSRCVRSIGAMAFVLVVLLCVATNKKILLEDDQQSSSLLTGLMKDVDDKVTASRIADLEKQLQRAKEELEVVASMRNKDGGGGATKNAFPVKSSIYDKGFNPIFVYSNRIAAAAEIPDKPHYGQVLQDKVVRALITAGGSNDGKTTTTKDEQPLFFVDLAANHYRELSNTLSLERNGWKGLCIEGNPMYWYELARYRKCTIVGAFVGGKEKEDGTGVEVVLGRGVEGGIAAKGMDTPANPRRKTDKREIVSIMTIFKETKTPKTIDYFSLDVEGAESLVMEDFPWDEYTFRFLTIERPKDDLKSTLQTQGYVAVAHLGTFGEELWMNTKYAGLSFDEASDIVEANTKAGFKRQRATLVRDEKNEIKV